MSKSIVFVRWTATFIGITGSILIASNITASKYAFLLFLVSNVLWGFAAYNIRDSALLLLQVVFETIDSYGIFRWLL